MSVIKKYCITNGTVNKVQQNLYEGGYIPGKADIAYAVKEARDIMQRGNMGEYQEFGYASSYTGFCYDTLYCFGKAMFQNANGREISCSQTLLCAWEDLADGEAFFPEVLLFPYLSLDELLASGTYTKQQVFGREPRNTSSNIQFSETQRQNIARAAYKLLTEKNVVLQLPSVTDYEEYSLAVLQEVFRVIPQRDRREISFATARTSNDIVRIRGRIKLILTSEKQPKTGEADWIHLNEETPLYDEEKIILQWQNEPAGNRKDIDLNFFTVEEDKHRSLKKDLSALTKLYNSASYWWRNPGNDRKMMSFDDVLSEYQTNPTLSIQSNRKEFFEKLCDMLDDSICDEDTPEKKLLSVLIDYMYGKKFEGKGKTKRLFETENALNAFLKACSDEYSWFGMNDQWVSDFKQEMSLLQEILRNNQQ